MTLQVQQEYRIPEGSTATVEANGIFGDQLIAVTPVLGVEGSSSPKATRFPPARDRPATAELLTKGDSIAADVRAMTGKARTEFVEGGGLKTCARPSPI